MLYKIVHNPCYFLSHIITPRPNVSRRTDRKRHELVRSVADLGLLQEQCHVCLGSHLTKPCLPCVVTSKTAAIHVGWQHNMCNFLGCKILQGSHPAAWDQEGLPSRQKNLPDAYWSIKDIHLLPCTIPCTFQPKPMYHPFTCHAPFNNLVSCTDYFFGTRLQYTFHLHMWQSRVEIEHYSVAYFDCIAAFEAL